MILGDRTMNRSARLAPKAKCVPLYRLSSARHIMTFFLVASLCGCGGGGSSGGSGSTGGTGSGDFSISLSSSSVALLGGQSVPVTLSIGGANTASSVSITITGLPSGVSVSPTNPTVVIGSQQQLMFSAAAAAPKGTANVSIQGTSGSTSHSVSLALTTNSPPPLTTRTRYVRTDASTLYAGGINQSWIVYDAASDRFFVSDTNGNRITVLDAAGEKVVGNVPVPGAYGIDFTPDHSVLYAGTQIGDVYAIDPIALKVTRRYIASQIGPYGYQAYAVRVLSDGRLALLGGQGGIPSVDGYSSFAIWDPSTNAFSMYMTGYSGGFMLGSNIPFSDACPDEGNIGGFLLSADRTHIITTSVDSDGTICSMNAATGQSLEAAGTGFIFHMVATPDGKELLVPASGSVAVYDASTLSPLRTFQVLANTSSAAVIALSSDSRTVYLDGDALIYAYDIATGNLVGWVPRLTVEPTAGGFDVGAADGVNFQAISASGLLAGPMEEGVGFIDTTSLQTGAPGSRFLNAYLTPATGPVSGGTPVQWSGASWSGNSKASLSAVYFGPNLATNISFDSSGLFHATSPSGKPGTVDVYSVMSDGGMQIIPEAFSYGPSIVEVTPDSSTSEGGGTGIIYGYGFGPVAYNCATPSDLQITVGGQSAKIVGYSCQAYNQASPPFLLQAVAYTIPAGTPGTAADVVVTTASGTSTLAGAVHYLPSLELYPLAGANLAQGVYDSTRDLYYFTDAGAIQVFSKSTITWLAPIPVPAPPSGAHRLWGISLSPSGSLLAVSDAGAGAIYVMDPGNPSSARSFPLAPAISGTTPIPAGLAISDSGMVYFAAGGVAVSSGALSSSFFKLDTSTAKVTSYGVSGDGSDNFLRAAISSDGARAYFNNDGLVFSVDTATDALAGSATGPGCCYGDDELNLSSNETQLTATGYVYDADLNGDAGLSMNDREVMNTTYVYGAKLSADGTLLFQPSVQGIDVFDGKLGTLRSRIALPVPVSEGLDALVSDGTDNELVILTGQTGTGIAVVDLSSLQEPAPLAYSSVVMHNQQNWSAWPMPRPASKPRMSRVPHAVNKLVQRPVLIPSSSGLNRNDPQLIGQCSDDHEISLAIPTRSSEVDFTVKEPVNQYRSGPFRSGVQRSPDSAREVIVRRTP